MLRQSPQHANGAPLGTGGVRTQVADHTRTIHEALHNDPLLGRLTAPDIDEQEYVLALGVLQGFYTATEAARRRLDLWDRFSLHHECAALIADLGTPAQPEPTLAFSNGAELLGGLYVAHGASFGRSLFRRNIALVLPDVPQNFVTQSTDKIVWRALTESMEQTGQTEQGARDLQRGAMRGFELVAAASATQRGGQTIV